MEMPPRAGTDSRLSPIRQDASDVMSVEAAVAELGAVREAVDAHTAAEEGNRAREDSSSGIGLTSPAVSRLKHEIGELPLNLESMDLEQARLCIQRVRLAVCEVLALASSPCDDGDQTTLAGDDPWAGTTVDEQWRLLQEEEGPVASSDDPNVDLASLLLEIPAAGKSRDGPGTAFGLDLEGCMLQEFTLPPAGLRSCTSLNLSCNSLSSVDLGGANALRSLHLGSNPVSDMPKALRLQGCRNLLALDLSYCQGLAPLPAAAFQGLGRLRCLTLDGMGIASLECAGDQGSGTGSGTRPPATCPSTWLAGLTALRELSLQENSLEDMDAIQGLRALGEAECMRELSLTDNPVVGAPGYLEAVLARVPTLQVLDSRRLALHGATSAKPLGEIEGLRDDPARGMDSMADAAAAEQMEQEVREALQGRADNTVVS